VPGLGDLPIVGRLFSSNRDELDKTEIILTITPRILRNIERPALADGEFFAGTESQTSDQPLRVRGRSLPPATEASQIPEPDVAAIQQVVVPPPGLLPPFAPVPRQP